MHAHIDNPNDGEGVAEMEFIDPIHEEFFKMKDDYMQEMDEASNHNEQYDHIDPNLNKGISIGSTVDDSNLQLSSSSILTECCI